MRLSFVLVVLVLLAVAACGETTAAPDAGTADAGPGVDGSPGPDGPPAAGPTPARAVLSGAGTLNGGAFTLDVQIGQVFVPRPVAGGGTTLTPSEPIQP